MAHSYYHWNDSRGTWFGAVPPGHRLNEGPRPPLEFRQTYKTKRGDKMSYWRLPATEDPALQLRLIVSARAINAALGPMCRHDRLAFINSLFPRLAPEWAKAISEGNAILVNNPYGEGILVKIYQKPKDEKE